MDLVQQFLLVAGNSPFCHSSGDFSLNCYEVKHQGHSYDKSKKVLDINSAPMKSSVYVNGVSNRRGVWRHNYEFAVVFV
jgi:hypothetical protein